MTTFFDRVQGRNRSYSGRGSGDDSGSGGRGRKLGALIGLILVIIIGLFYVIDAFERVEPGSVGLVRNGGWFSPRTFQKVITVNDGVTYIGYGSTVNDYPTGDLYDDVEPGEYRGDPAAGDTGSVDRYRVRTKDGQDVGVQGQWRYTLNVGSAALEKFDAKFGIRDYGLPGDEYKDKRFHVYDGLDGIRSFIFNQMRQPQEEAIQAGFSSVNGAQLDPSLALLTVTSTDPTEISKASAAAAAATDQGGTFAAVSNDISTKARPAINKALGQTDAEANDPNTAFITSIRFTLRAISPSKDTLDRVEQVRGSVAGLAAANAKAAADVAAANGEAQKEVADAEGRRLVAEKDAAAQVARQAGYNACTTCADIDKTRAQGDAQKAANEGWGDHAPQVYAPGSNSSFLPVPGR